METMINGKVSMDKTQGFLARLSVDEDDNT